MVRKLDTEISSRLGLLNDIISLNIDRRLSEGATFWFKILDDPSSASDSPNI